MEFRYSLEDAGGNTILSAKPTLDEVVKYLDENTTTATQYRLVIRSNNTDRIFYYTRTEDLPNVNDASVRKVFNLNG